MSLTKDAHWKIVAVNSSMSINDCRCFDDYSNGFCRIGSDVQKIWHNKRGKWLTQGSARRRTFASEDKRWLAYRDLLPNLAPLISRVCSGYAPDRGVLRTQLV
jgi:hypothetical protein